MNVCDICIRLILVAHAIEAVLLTILGPSHCDFSNKRVNAISPFILYWRDEREGSSLLQHRVAPTRRSFTLTCIRRSCNDETWLLEAHPCGIYELTFVASGPAFLAAFVREILANVVHCYGRVVVGVNKAWGEGLGKSFAYPVYEMHVSPIDKLDFYVHIPQISKVGERQENGRV